ncbi:MAG: hypothetical protein IKI22_03930 [Neisseriaceae bacterium]|nr:hypothetical protein [Neisseriaceae bacterium]
MDNDYLIVKPIIKNTWHIFILIICGLFFIAGITIIPQGFAQDIEQGIVNTFLTSLFAIPIVRIVLSYIRMAIAKKYAYVFSNNTDTTISFTELCKHLHRSNVEDELQKLISKGYLKNIVVDLNTQTVLLKSPKAHQAKKIYVNVQCIGCGSTETIVKGELAKCSYCKRSLMG